MVDNSVDGTEQMLSGTRPYVISSNYCNKALQPTLRLSEHRER